MEEALKMNSCPNCRQSLSNIEEKKKNSGFMIVLGLIAASFMIFLWNYLTQERPEDTIQEQWKAISARQLTEAYYAYTSKDFQDSMSLEDFKDLVNFIPQPLKGDGLELIEVEDVHPFKAIEGVIQGVDPAVLKVYYEMLFQDGLWKVDGMLLLEEA